MSQASVPWWIYTYLHLCIFVFGSGLKSTVLSFYPSEVWVWWELPVMRELPRKIQSGQKVNILSKTFDDVICFVNVWTTYKTVCERLKQLALSNILISFSPFKYLDLFMDKTSDPKSNKIKNQLWCDVLLFIKNKEMLQTKYKNVFEPFSDSLLSLSSSQCNLDMDIP